MAEEKKLLWGYNKLEWSWIMQDWANSAFSLMITTALFPIVYNGVAEAQGVSAADSTAYLGYANSIATLLVGISAPILGSMADYRGFRKPMFTVTTLMGIIGVALMAFIPTEVTGSWILLLIVYVIASMGFSASNVFYDASLTDVTTRQRSSRVSATGYAMGYIGSSLPFILYIIALVTIDSLPITMDQLIVIGFLGTSIWWLVFTIPYWRNVHQTHWIEPEAKPIRNSFKRLGKTLSQVKDHKNVFIFLLAYFVYIDGVGTIIKMATSVGADLGLGMIELVIMLLLVQIVAFPFSILYGNLATKHGEKPIITVGIITYLILCIFALFISAPWHFYILGFMVGTAQGGVQSLSRSLFSKLIPEGENNNQFFGLFNVFGKFSSIIGTTLLGVITQATGNSLNGVFSIIALFLVGLILFRFVEVPEEA